MSVTALFGRTARDHRAALGDRPLPGTRWWVGGPRDREARLRQLDRAAGGFDPEVVPLRDQLRSLWHRFGDGRAILGSRAVALVLRRLLDAQPERWPSFAAIPDRADAARTLAGIDHALSLRRALPPDAELHDLRGALREAVAVIDGIREADALEGLLERAHSLHRALAATPRLWIDEPVGGGPLVAEVVATLATVAGAAGVEVVVLCSSGRDEGGREIAALLGWEGADRSVRAFAATAPLRRALLERVGTGEVEVARADASGWTPIEPWTEWGEPGPRTLADAVADQLAAPVATDAEARAFCAGTRFVRAADRVAAARWVARDLSERLRAGVDPTDCAVLLADPAGDGPLLAEVLTDHGVPFRPAGGAPVGGHPVVHAVRAIVGAALDGYDPDRLCALADLSPAFRADARAVRRWARGAGVTGGRPRDWAIAGWATRTHTATAAQVDAALAELDALAERLAPFAAPATVPDWARRLHDTFAALELPARCAHGDAAHAWASAVRELEGVVRDASRALPGEVAPGVLRDELDRALAGARWDPSPRAIARVAVVPFDEAPVEPPPHTWVLGGIRGRFPTPPSPTLARVDPTRSGYDEPARWRMGALLRAHAVRWVWPATQNGSAVAPSPLLAEVLDLPTRAPGIRLGDWVVEDARAEPYGGSAIDRDRASPPAGLGTASVRARTGPLGPYDGWFDVPPPPPSALSVSALETYVACPARYWYTHGLSLSPPEDAAPELEPRRRGIALHAILERFLEARSLAPLAGDPDPAGARRALHHVASTVLDEVEAGGGFDPLFQQYARRRWLAGLDDDRPAGVLRVWLDGELGSVGVVPEGVEWPVRGLVLGGVPIRGIVDRLDRVGGASVVTDYKTGTPPSRARIEAGLSLQPLAYAEMVARHTGRPVAATFLSLARADRVRRTSFVGESAALDAACSEPERRRAVVVEAPERARRLERAGAAVEALVAGRFPPSPHPPDLAGCPICAFRRICRVDRTRHAA